MLPTPPYLIIDNGRALGGRRASCSCPLLARTVRASLSIRRWQYRLSFPALAVVSSEFHVERRRRPRFPFAPRAGCAARLFALCIPSAFWATREGGTGPYRGDCWPLAHGSTQCHDAGRLRRHCPTASFRPLACATALREGMPVTNVAIASLLSIRVTADEAFSSPSPGAPSAAWLLRSHRV
jgi:hypothetical protein